jgi:hypothetical protein
MKIDTSKPTKSIEKQEEHKQEPAIERQILGVLNHIAASLEGIEYELERISSNTEK